MLGANCSCLGVFCDPVSYVFFFNSLCPLNLLLVQSHQAEIIIVKCLIQRRNKVTRVRIDLRSCDQGRRKNDVLALSLVFFFLLCSLFREGCGGSSERLTATLHGLPSRDGTGQNFLDSTGKFQNLRWLTSF